MLPWLMVRAGGPTFTSTCMRDRAGTRAKRSFTPPCRVPPAVACGSHSRARSRRLKGASEPGRGFIIGRYGRIKVRRRAASNPRQPRIKEASSGVIASSQIERSERRGHGRGRIEIRQPTAFLAGLQRSRPGPRRRRRATAPGACAILRDLQPQPGRVLPGQGGRIEGAVHRRHRDPPSRHGPSTR